MHGQGLLVWFAAILLLLAAPRGSGAETNARHEPPGLSIDSQGRLRLRGALFRGLGVNYYDAFVRTLRNPPGADCAAGFQRLAREGIPFARFSAGGYWPVDWRLYQTDPAEYWRRFDLVVRAAEKAGIGLIPSLFWHYPTFSDLAGEPILSWGEGTSRTRAFMRTYVREVVTRYKDSAAIWAWEFGNEFNLGADLPNAAEHRPPIQPGLGTPAARSEKDDLTHTAMRSALEEFGREVRRYDGHRLVLSGNAFPRPSAWHQMRRGTWEKDSESEWAAMLTADNPEPLRSLSGRLYAPSDLALLPWAAAAARAAKRPLFVGEFGVSGPATPDAGDRLGAWLDALEKNDVALAAFWVFDFDGQRGEWSATFDDARAPLLRQVAERHRRWIQDRPSRP